MRVILRGLALSIGATALAGACAEPSHPRAAGPARRAGPTSARIAEVPPAATAAAAPREAPDGGGAAPEANIPDAGPPPLIDVPPGKPILGELTAPEQRQLDQLLDRLCAWREVTREGKKVRGCACCPPFDRCPPGSKLPAGDEVYPLRRAPRGSFSATGKRQMAATFWGCESHAANWGGTLLLEQTARGWKTVRYVAGLNAVCDAVARPGQNDLLICLWFDAHQGWAHYRVDTFDFSVADDEQAWTNLVDAQDNTMSACTSGMDSFPVVQHIIDHVELVDADGDGRRDLVVPVAARKGRSHAQYRDTCMAYMDWESGQATSGPRPDPFALLPAAQSVKLLFRFDGQGFTATPKTKLALAWLHAELDSFFAQHE